MRRRFGKILSKIAEKDKKIVLLVGDIGFGIFDDFRKKHPKRFFNLGPQNNWEKLLPDEIRKKIEKEFHKEMVELGYLK